MEIGHLIPHIEALIFASDKPLTALELTELINNAFGFMEDKIVLDQVESALEGIVEKYKSEFYPFEVRESGGGWQFLTKRDYHKTVAQLNGDKFLKRLSTAALEALSIIAYKQPVTKAEIEAIRGVSSDYAIQKLLEKELIVITGRNEKMPGHPLVYGTSKNFMDYFGINTAEDLPKLKEVFDEAMVNATNVNDAIAEQASHEAAGNTAAGDRTDDDAIVMVVGENGELIEGATGHGHLNGEAVDFVSAGETNEEESGEEGTETTAGEELIVEHIVIEEIEEDPGPDSPEEEEGEEEENGEDDDEELEGEDLEEENENGDEEEENDLEEEEDNEGEDDEEGEDDGKKDRR
ncbi:SMC-Scp complex subunit ScpB [Pseudoflavitalea sp. X16]|uniref:SMC-Scp complex subunit ScpB n=1 Tax=Paraflavitalea devenefica TaxID=2716334 RepID=UPI00141E42A8|nr:SMC-Scp complex subunit ScpB [Paraflavitalea devenefica]NII25302.1 SMC-Scp complex subunit ScpB [Paraflavitalea devenefica]